MFRKLAAAAASALFVIAAPVSAQQKWDMPTGYPASNFHTENIHQFAADVDKATGGKLKITVHDSGSLFKANEIKRAVQGGQAQIGEIIISGYSNEDAMYGVDSIPFLATSYSDSQKLWQASRQATEARLAEPVAPASGRRHLWNQPTVIICSRARSCPSRCSRLAGPKVAR